MTEDTGLEWRGWHRSASEALLHATNDPRASCVIDNVKEAIRAGQQALRVAKNKRQRDVTESLLDVAHKIKNSAEHTLLHSELMDD